MHVAGAPHAPMYAVVRRHLESLHHSSAKADRIPIGHISGLRYCHLMHPSSSISGGILSSLSGLSRMIKPMYDLLHPYLLSMQVTTGSDGCGESNPLPSQVLCRSVSRMFEGL
jgi:hypothetical protein